MTLGGGRWWLRGDIRGCFWVLVVFCFLIWCWLHRWVHFIKIQGALHLTICMLFCVRVIPQLRKKNKLIVISLLELLSFSPACLTQNWSNHSPVKINRTTFDFVTTSVRTHSHWVTNMKWLIFPIISSTNCTLPLTFFFYWMSTHFITLSLDSIYQSLQVIRIISFWQVKFTSAHFLLSFKLN